MARKCKHYKSASCRGDRTCTNASLCNTKFCPYVKDGKFLGNKAKEACRGYVATAGRPAACRKSLAGPYDATTQHSPGCVYTKLVKASNGGSVVILVDHTGCAVPSGNLLRINPNTGHVERMNSITSQAGLDLDSTGRLKI